MEKGKGRGGEPRQAGWDLLQCKVAFSNLSSNPNLFWPLLPQNSTVFRETKCNRVAFNSRIELTD